MTVASDAEGAGSSLAAEARRLALSNALTRACIAVVGGAPIPPSSPEALIDVACELANAATAEQSRGVRFDPPFPGVGEAPRSTTSGSRLLLACRLYSDGAEIGVAFTTLLPGRLPQVSVAPPAASIPPDWKPPSATFEG
jgi:hypothetical protein